MSAQRMKQSPFLWLLGLVVSVAAGCGGGEQFTFRGDGRFDVATGTPPALAPILITSEVTLRHAGRGTSELVLDPTCSVRLRAGRVIGTQRCEIATASGSVQLNFQDGTWGVTESITSGGSCDRWRYDVLVNATGTVRGNAAQGAHFTFRGVREETACSSSSSSGVGSGVWIWDEGEGYPGDVYDDWESDYSDDGYDDGGYYDDDDYDDGYDDGDYDDGDYDDGDYDDGDYDDGGYDDGGYDGGDDGGGDDESGGYSRGARRGHHVR